jgi:hypothetical protein
MLSTPTAGAPSWASDKLAHATAAVKRSERADETFTAWLLVCTTYAT